MGGRLIVVCGLPGSGKTTLAKRLQSERGGIRLCADEWMEALGVDLWDAAMRAKVEGLQWAVGRELLGMSQTVIVEWGTWAREERDALRMGARELGAAVELHFLDAPVDVLFERIRARGMETPPIRRGDVERWSRMIQRPTEEETALFDVVKMSDD